MWMRTTFFIVLIAAAPLDGSQITSSWIGGTGDWTDPAQWSLAGVPNNGANTYLVNVNSGGADVANILTQNIYIDGITVGPKSTVHANDQGLVLGTPVSVAAMLTNAGNINLTNAANLTLDYSAGASAANSGTISVGDESALYLTAPTPRGGTLTNTGNIALTANPNGSQVYLYGDGATFTLNGGGNLTLSDNAANLITGSFGTETLISNNKIAGAGSITTLANFTNNGTVTANGVNPLVFNMDNGTAGVTGTIINNGTMQAAAGSSLILQGSADLAVTNNGAIALNAQGSLVSGFLYNDNNTGSALHLSGPGTLSLSDSPGNIVAGINGDETLINELAHTITGAGTIGNFKVIENNGLIAANGTNPLILALNNGPTAHGDLVNSGTIQVNDGATLEFRSDGALINNLGYITLNASHGTSTLVLDNGGAAGQFLISNAAGQTGQIILSDNPGNRLLGRSGAEVLILDKGQQLSGAGTIGNFNIIENKGAIIANGNNPLILSGLAGELINDGTLQVNDRGTLLFRSAGVNVDNEGLIALNAAKGTSTLSFDDSGIGAEFSIVNTASGGGKIVLSDNAGNRITGVNGTEFLFLGNGQQLSGAGTVGNFGFIDNHGTITANGANPLILALSSTTNPFGNLENAGAIKINDGSTLEIGSGVWINNIGSITLNAAAQTSTLAFNNSQPLLLGSATSAGQVTMSDNPGNRIVGITGQETLVNNAAHTIQGAGTIANFGGGFVNNGTVIANGANPLIIDISAATTRGNAGLTTGGVTEIQNGGTLQILSTVGGTVSTAGSGEIFLAAATAGTSTLSFNDQGKAQTFLLAGGALGPAYTVVMSIGGNRIAGVNGDETLVNGLNSTIIGQGVIANFARFTNNGGLETGGGVLEVQAPLGNWNGTTATLAGGTWYADDGMVKVDSLGSKTITNLSGAAILAQGVGFVTGDGTVNALTGLTNVTNSLVSLDGLAKPLAITPTGTNTLALTNSELDVLRGASVSINGSLSQDATSKIVVGNSSSIAASDFVNSGTLTVNAAGTATFKGAVSNTGLVELTAAAQLSVIRSPFLAFGTNVYTQTAGNTKVLTGGILEAATVDLEGGTLGGGGNIVANVVVSGGTLAPGDPTTTNITGDLTMENDGEILLDIDGTGAGMFDAIDVNGNVHLDGGTLDIVFQNGFLPQTGQSWDLLNFTGIEDGPGFGSIVFENAGNANLAAFFNGQSYEIGTQQAQAAPEPCTFPLMAALLAGIGCVTRLTRRAAVK